jgi:hypothetical protein
MPGLQRGFAQSTIIFTMPEVILLSSTKQNMQCFKFLRKFRYNKTVIAFLGGEHLAD